MKARQISVAPDSVYALGPSGQLSVIERTPEGLWGRWQATGVDARCIAHAGHVIARIGLDDRVSAFQRGSDLPWFTWGLHATELATAHLPDGTPVLFAVSDGSLAWCAWKPAPVAPWSDWQPLDGPIGSIAAEVIPGGGLVLFGLRDGTVHHKWQDRPLAPWKKWTELGRPPGGARSLGAATIAHGGLALFTLGEDGGLYHRWQDKPFGAWHDWEPLGGESRSFAVARFPVGGLAVFAVGTDDGVRYRCQSRAFGEWREWVDLRRKARRVAAQTGYSDGLEVFAIGLDAEVSHTWCDSLDAKWSAWQPLDYESSSLHLS
jgi:hypothetical protein